MTEYGCLECGHQFETDSLFSVTCPECGSDFINNIIEYEPEPQGEENDTASN